MSATLPAPDLPARVCVSSAELTHEFLQILEKTPNRLKRIRNWRVRACARPWVDTGSGFWCVREAVLCLRADSAWQRLKEARGG